VLKLFRRSQEEEKADEQRLHDSLEKTRGGLFGRLGSIFQANEITEETWDELEETLILGDVGAETSARLVGRVRERVNKEGIKRAEQAQVVLKQEMLAILAGANQPMEIDEPRLLTVVLIVGVNGSGKTTSIAKLAKLYKDHGRKVVLGRLTPSAPQRYISLRSGATVWESTLLPRARAPTLVRWSSMPSVPAKRAARPTC
jgi:fused signal recognition particle receptor